MSKKEAGWWDAFFPAFRPVMGSIPRRTTNAQLRYIIKKLNLRPGRRFLDCPCGIGRIALPLARAGIRVTGVDITESYLEELARKARAGGLPIDLQWTDMRRIKHDSQFDAAANIGTSFGYFKRESDNLLVLKKMYKALKGGGKFLLHTINRDWLIANFRSSDWFQAGDTRVLEETNFDYATSVNNCRWTLVRNGQERSYEFSLRLYSLHELTAMFRQVGFVDIEGYGSEKDEPVSCEKRRLFVFGTKPGRRK